MFYSAWSISSPTVRSRFSLVSICLRLEGTMVGTHRDAAASVACCFCGQSLAEQTAVRMVIFPSGTGGESQTLFCHRHHLVQHLDPKVPRHPALEDDDNEQAS